MHAPIPHDSSTMESGFPRRLGRYVLLSRLGESSTGRVYLALSREPGRRERIVIIKRFGNPGAHLLADQIEESRQRFRREAKITMALAHPSIARTFAHVQADNESYLVQEFVHGVTLDHLISSMARAGECFPIPVAAALVCKLADALDYVHEFRGLGLIHRDLTPTNVMVSQEGEVKIIDFNTAKATLADDRVTKPQAVVGQPLWTPPEVVAGATSDRRTDLYALGLILWSLLSGREPEESLLDDLFLRQPSSFNSGVPLELDEIVTRAIDRQPDRRFQTARAFREAVLPFASPSAAAEEVLALLLSRCPPVLDKRTVDDAVAHGRSLLDVSPPRRRWLALAGAAALVPLAVLGAWAAVRDARLHWPPRMGPMPQASSPVAPPAPPAASDPGPKMADVVAEPPSRPPTPARTGHAEGRPPKLDRHDEPSRVPAAPLTAPCPETEPNASPHSAEDMLASALDALARSDNQRALALAHSSLMRQKTPDAYILIGRILFDSDPPAAQAALESALRLSPANRQATRLLEGLRQRNP